MNASRRQGEHGSGALSTAFGITVFLVLLTWCAHLLVDRWRDTTIDAVAHDAATDVAESGVSVAELPAVEADAVRRARETLGPTAADVHFEFLPSPPDRVVLRVRTDDLDRTITVHREPGHTP